MKKILFTFISLALIISCNKEQDLNKVEETMYVRHQDTDMPVYLRGNFSSNIVILVVHGGPGGNGLEYRSGTWTVELEERYGMAYWDQRGQGMSHGKYSSEQVTINQMVKDMDAVIQAIKFKYGKDTEIIAYGHSWGGLLTAKYLVTGSLQQNLLGWISSNGAHDIPKNDVESVKLFRRVADEQIAQGNSVDKWQEIKTWAEAIDTNAITDEQSGEINSKGFEVEKWLTDDGVLQDPEEGGNSGSGLFSPINLLGSQIQGSLTNGLLNDEIQQTELTNELQKVNIPSLSMGGAYDFVVAPKLAIDIERNISSSVKRLEIFSKSGHSPMSNEAEDYSASIISFIEVIR